MSIHSEGLNTDSEDVYAVIEQLNKLFHDAIPSEGLSTEDVSAMIERLNKLFHDEKEAYTKLLACRGSSAQWLLDLFQDVSLGIGYAEWINRVNVSFWIST
jgi:hypothetical protein